MAVPCDTRGHPGLFPPNMNRFLQNIPNHASVNSGGHASSPPCRRPVPHRPLPTKTHHILPLAAQFGRRDDGMSPRSGHHGRVAGSLEGVAFFRPQSVFQVKKNYRCFCCFNRLSDYRVFACKNSQIGVCPASARTSLAPPFPVQSPPGGRTLWTNSPKSSAQ